MYPSTQSIREIVKIHPSAISVFERFDIDLCSLADSSLEQHARNCNCPSIKCSKNSLGHRAQNPVQLHLIPRTCH